MTRFIAILAVLVLCLSVLPMAALAADKTYYMAGTLAPGGWDPGAASNKMTLVGGVWTITNHVAAGNYEFKFTSGGWGQDEYPSSGNLSVNVESECDVTVTYDPATHKYTVTGDGIAGPAFYLAGDFNGWNAAGYKMTKSGNLWKYTISNMAAGSYAFKVTNGTWDEAYPGSNKTFEVATACDVTITFDQDTKEIKVTGNGLAGALTVNSVHVAGNGVANNAWCNGIAWSSDAAENKMTAEGGIYTITYNGVLAGEYQFKFTINGGWAHSLGLANKIVAGQKTDVVYGADNIWLDVPATSNVTITLDMTGFDAVAMTGAKATVTVTAVEGGEQGGGEGDDKEENKPAPEITEITVHAQVPADWGTPKVWAWSDAGNLATTGWPGELDMTQGENGWWTIKIPVGMKGVLIVNTDGSKQTVDINIEQQKMDIWAAVGTAGGDGKFSVDVDYTNPKTGDETALLSAAVVMVLAAAAAAVVVSNKRKFTI